MTTEMQIDSYLTTLRTILALSPSANGRRLCARSPPTSATPPKNPEPPLRLFLPAGPADELAAQVSRRAAHPPSQPQYPPLQAAPRHARLATKGVSGVVVFFLAIFGYLMGGGLVLTVLIKPIFPANTGVWFNDERFVSSGTLFPAPAPPRTKFLACGIYRWRLRGQLALLFTTGRSAHLCGFHNAGRRGFKTASGSHIAVGIVKPGNAGAAGRGPDAQRVAVVESG